MNVYKNSIVTTKAVLHALEQRYTPADKLQKFREEGPIVPSRSIGVPTVDKSLYGQTPQGKRHRRKN